MAAPIRDHTGEVIAALSFSVPKYRFLEMKQAYRNVIVEAAKEISEALGYEEARGGEVMSERVKVAILGSGNIGTDLMYKLLKNPGHMELVAVVGIDPKSEGLARARALGLEASHEGIAYILERPEIKIVFDATSAKAHVRHAKLLREAGKIAIDLTPAARGPYVVPPVNLKEHLDKDNVNLITCGGQATIPLVYAVHRVAPVLYAEMVSTVASAPRAPAPGRTSTSSPSPPPGAWRPSGGPRRGRPSSS